MRALSAPLVPLSLVLALVAARVHHSRVPEDPYAFPKYRVSFLHGLPVLNDTAERWLRDGLRGGEPEFLDQPWQESHWLASPLKSIEADDDASPSDAAQAQDANYTLQRMRFGPKTSYVCLIPPPPKEPPPVEDTPTDVATPVHSWSLLQPLSGKCLYWEAYTLGRAPPTLEAGAELTTAEAAAAANLELARGAGSRYLVQRWSDGTYCDKTGRKRDVEFHCSMTMTDTVLFVKETQTCHYVVHIATPRLCGEPGFRSRIDAEEEHFIRCREVLDAAEYESADRDVRPASHPFRRPRQQKKVIAPPPPPPAETKAAESADEKAASDVHSEILRRALQRLLAHREHGPDDTHEVVEQLPDGEGEFVVSFVDVELPEGADDAEYADILIDDGADFGGRLHDILRAAGYEIRGEKADGEAVAEQDDRDSAEEGKAKKHRDEL
ncbi:Protein OS-9 -like protein [Trametes pubescens]|uniref:Protein OS-9 homolog n=1 Tax=Trametes pubescens TaxID=154538 RepID=A0A1M2V6B0_TRAPU|nr:Protein OS-9 -like protein [Trametes pubescens]